MKKSRLIILIIIFCFSLIGIIYSSLKIISWYSDNNKTNEQIEKLQQLSKVNEEKDDNNGSMCFSCKKDDFINVEFSELEMINKDVVGWIKLEGTNINYPFVKTENNKFYLTHSFNKTYNEAGWVFLDYRNDIDDLSINTIIYAHGRVDKTMFGSLKDTLNYGWFNNLDNRLLKISTPYNNYVFEVFSIYHIKTTNDYLKTSFSNVDEYINFIDLIKNRSIHKFNNSVTANDKIITLSTCYNNWEKMVLHAKLIDSEKRY